MLSRSVLFLGLLSVWTVAVMGGETTETKSEDTKKTLASNPAMVAAVEPVTDTYFGETVVDPYRWLEQLDSPRTQAWMRHQANHTEATLQQIPERARIIEKLQQLPKLAGGSCVHETGAGALFFLRDGRLFLRTRSAGSERLLLDPATLKHADWPETQKRSIDYVFPSPEGNLVAVGVSAGGSEQSILYILSAKNGAIVDGPIDRSHFSFRNVAWLPGEKKLLIRRFPELPANAPNTEKMLRSQVWLHQVGSPAADDVLVFGSQYPQALGFEPQDWAVAYTTPKSPYVLGVRTIVGGKLGVYLMPRKDLGKPGAVWRRLFDFSDQVVDFALHGDMLYALTRKDAPNGRVFRMKLKGAHAFQPTEFLAETQQIIDWLGGAQDALYLKVRHGVYEQVMQVPYGGGIPRALPFAEEGSVALPNTCGTGAHFGLLASPEIKGVNVLSGSWLKPYTLQKWHPSKNRWQEVGLFKTPQLDTQNYRIENLQVPSHDGVRVPLSLIWSKSNPPGKPQPVLLSAYGAYGSSRPARLRPEQLVWLEQGFALASCHARGGGEYGEAWRLAGYQKNKFNTWKDMIACAEYLIAQGYTSAEQLVGFGGSAGGIAIGNALVERPDLFRAAIIEVGIVDTLRGVVASANGPNHYIEEGDPRTLEGFQIVRDNSAYLKVKDGVSYPAVLLVYGVNDARVEVWQGSKMAARLQAATTSAAEKPILLRLDYGGGHTLGRAESEADQISFALWQTGKR